MDIILQVDLKDLDLNETIGGYYEDDDSYVRGGSTVAGAVVGKLVEHEPDACPDCGDDAWSHEASADTGPED
jgi:hypothetical protein